MKGVDVNSPKNRIISIRLTRQKPLNRPDVFQRSRTRLVLFSSMSSTPCIKPIKNTEVRKTATAELSPVNGKMIRPRSLRLRCQPLKRFAKIVEA